MNRHALKNILSAIVVVGLLLALMVALPTAAQGPEGLSIEMESPGHWHFGHEKLLIFTVTDDQGAPVSGLSPTVVVKAGTGTVTELSEVLDNGDGTYAVEYTAPEVGSGYALGYSIGFAADHQGTHYSNFWPAEVVRDGREDILPEVDGTLYAYQVRYGWSPGSPQPGDEVTFFFEPRRAIQTGADINTEQPFRNTFNHLPDLTDATFLVQAPDGSSQELPAEYAGLGIYGTAYTPAQEGDYTVSLLFTDPANEAQIGQNDNAYVLTVASAAQEAPVEAPPALPVSGAPGGPTVLALVLIAIGILMLATGVLSTRRQKG